MGVPSGHTVWGWGLSASGKQGPGMLDALQFTEQLFREKETYLYLVRWSDPSSEFQAVEKTFKNYLNLKSNFVFQRETCSSLCTTLLHIGFSKNASSLYLKGRLYFVLRETHQYVLKILTSWQPCW